ncbi:MAG: hypothetical protein ACREQV_03605, partial [Candidatus Binatia bacterium]
MPITERDVPFVWNTKRGPQQTGQTQVGEKLFVDVRGKTGAGVTRPRRLSFLPVSLSFWPKFLQREEAAPDPGKKKVRKTPFNLRGATFNLTLLAVGFGILSFFWWNMQGVARGLAALPQIEGRAAAAFDELVRVQSALAETDIQESERALSSAHDHLSQARGELSAALDSTRHILRYVDVTGTVASGQELLAAGESLTQAGQHVARGVGPFFEVSSVLAAEGGSKPQDGPSLVNAVQSMQREFGLAAGELEKAQQSLGAVSSPLLPEDIKRKVATLTATLPAVHETILTLHKQSASYLHLLGANHDRQYLLVFANNHEIRPVGGFIGTVG